MGRDSQYLGVYYCHAAESGLLPAEYFAMPLVTLGGGVQVEVGTFQAGAQPESINGGVITQLWAPPQPSLSAVVDFVSLDVYEVRVMQQMGGPKLRSAIELVSLANKDRASHRRAFAIKCASYLQKGVAVIIVDVVTERTANLHAALADILRLAHPLAWCSPSQLYAVAYRPTQAADAQRSGSMASSARRRGYTAYDALVAERDAVPAAGARGELSGDLCRPPHPRVNGQAVAIAS